MLYPDLKFSVGGECRNPFPIGIICSTHMYYPDSFIMRLLVFVICAGVAIVNSNQRNGLDNSQCAYQAYDRRYTQRPTAECMILHGRLISQDDIPFQWISIQLPHLPAVRRLEEKVRERRKTKTYPRLARHRCHWISYIITT